MNDLRRRDRLCYRQAEASRPHISLKTIGPSAGVQQSDRKLKRRRGTAPPGTILGAFRKSVAADGLRARPGCLSSATPAVNPPDEMSGHLHARTTAFHGGTHAGSFV